MDDDMISAWENDYDDDYDYDESNYDYDDVNHDAEVLASAGWGTDEDYGYYGDY